jgi:ferredoxin
MKVSIDEDRCRGAGQRVLIAPPAFDQREDGVTFLLDVTPAARLHGTVRETAVVCPGAAIYLGEGV